MRRLLAILAVLIWAAWFGGLMTVFLVVTSLFGTFAADRHTAGAAAAGVFHSFERYQLILAAAALLTTVLWRVAGGAVGLKNVLFAGFTAATLLAAGVTTQITPRIDQLREAGTTTGGEFGRLHGMASAIYLGESVVLLIVAFVLVAALVRDAEGTTKKKKA